MKKLYFGLSFIIVIFSLISCPVCVEAAAAKNKKASAKETCASVIAANSMDYKSTMIDLGERYSVDEMNDLLSGYGRLTRTPGMPTIEYIRAMTYEWKDVTGYGKTAKEVSVDLNVKYTYKYLTGIMKQLSAYNGVYMYKIGESSQGRPMYALEIDRRTKKWKEENKTVLLTGQIHGREFAGSVFILKQMAQLLQADTKNSGWVLSRVRFVCVPCINPDGFSGVAYDTSKWTYSNEQYWKANAQGTDLNRNFPALSWMMVKKGIEESEQKSSSPKKMYYPGPYSGSAPEVKAMIKFYQYFIGVEGAEMLIDYHQQGRVSYAGKGYAPDEMNEKCEKLRDALYAEQKKGSAKSRYSYDYGDTEESYGFNGVGSTNTDFAWSVALGAKFSTRYGFLVYTSKKGKREYPLLKVPQRDKTDYNLSEIAVPGFCSFSWEIGDGEDYLGYGKTARAKFAREYEEFNFERMPYIYAVQIMKN